MAVFVFEAFICPELVGGRSFTFIISHQVPTTVVNPIPVNKLSSAFFTFHLIALTHLILDLGASSLRL